MTLRNEGVDGFKIQEYGRSITIDRKFTADSNTYTLKDEHGRSVSKNKEELIAILDHFNIQVENPLMILNQDTAREFLTNTDAAEKYKVRVQSLSHHNSRFLSILCLSSSFFIDFFLKFLMKGTLLDQIHQNLNSVIEYENDIKGTLEGKSADLKDMRATVKAIGAKVTELKQLDQLEENKAKLSQMMAWALVEEKEKALEDQEKELNKAQMKVEPVENRIAAIGV